MICLIDLNNLKTGWGSGQTMIPFECENCQKTFYVKQKFVKNYIKDGFPPRFCSSKCEGLRKTQPKITIKCKNCGEETIKTNRQIRKNKNHFCSKSCATTWLNQHKTHGCRSKLERWLEEKLKILYPNLTFIFNDRFAVGPLELDIYIPSLKLAFELNGIFHYEEIFGKEHLDKTQNNDHRKFQACIEKEISLCVIDTSKQTYVKEKTCLPFLNIITNIIDKKTSRPTN